MQPPSSSPIKGMHVIDSPVTCTARAVDPQYWACKCGGRESSRNENVLLSALFCWLLHKHHSGMLIGPWNVLSTRAMVPRMMAGPPFGIRESVGLPTTLDGVGPCRIRDASAVIGREALPQVGPQPRDISFGHFANGLN